MCGITGYKKFSSNRTDLKDCLEIAVQTLDRRGPDFQDTWINDSIGLGHSRLSIIDTSTKANQPMIDPTGRYALVYNGEIYNFKELKKDLSRVEWKSTSDTEVLLHLLIRQGKDCLDDLNGFFALAFYDKKEDHLLIARDRMGIKPLHYFQTDEFFAFGSEMKALLSFPIQREVDTQSLYWYLRLTYLPSELSMIKGVKKLLPGHYLEISGESIENGVFSKIEPSSKTHHSYQEAKRQTVELLETSVERRMVADVPLGAFLSGGTDSSAVVSMASKFNDNLNTFSIGYQDHEFFDETHYAELVARKFGTNHTTFSLSNDDLLDDLNNVLDYLDEPFGDSSAIPTYILSKRVSQSMKVALSGDGADELFGGYYKHLAFTKSNHSNLINTLLKPLDNLIASFPSSRSSALGNLSRRVSKYTKLLNLSANEKYWLLASFNLNANELLLMHEDSSIDKLVSVISPRPISDLNEFLDADLQMVLPGDMLTKVDLMSMANSLEVRVPFLDKDLVNFARTLPPDYKIRGNRRKSVLQDAFEHILPKELHHRPKKGFEVPMLPWLRNELNSDLNETVFDLDFLQSQKLFVPTKILNLKKQLTSQNPGDVHSVLWTLYVFQKWYQRMMS